MQLAGLEWQRPWGAVALVLPVLVWLLARRRGRAQGVWTGTLELWREVAAVQARRERRAHRLPVSVRLLIAALVAGGLALAGPTAPRTDVPRTWTVVVDRSPSMYLAWLAPAAGPERGGTRLERGVERAVELLSEVRARDDRVAWLSYHSGLPVRVEGVTFPRDWLVAPRVAQEQPPWTAHDSGGTLWLTDAGPPSSPREAGLVQAGGAAVPGFVAATGTTRLEWDGERVVERAGAGPRPAVALEPGLQGPLERVVRAWADARGCEVVESASEQVLLVLEREPGTGRDAGDQARAGRDGWTWEIELDPGSHPRGDVWLREARSGLPVVAFAPGRITLAAGRYEREPAGDPADFALSWSALLDRTALPPAGVVPLQERRAAGLERVVAPRPAPAAGAGPSRRWIEAWLAFASATLTLVAWGLRRR